MSNPCNIIADFGGDWQSHYGLASCPASHTARPGCLIVAMDGDDACEGACQTLAGAAAHAHGGKVLRGRVAR